MEVGFGASGVVIAVLLWRMGMRLEPDARGRSLGSLPSAVQWSLFTGVILLAPAGAILAGSALGYRPAAFAFGLFAAMSPALAVIDSALHRLPYLASGTLIAAGAACFWWDAAAVSDFSALERAAWAALVGGVFGFVLWVPRRGLGPGDVVLLIPLSGYAGWMSWPLVWWGVGLGAIAAAVGVCVSLLWKRWGRIEIPYGAYLLAGWWLAVAMSDRITQLHLSIVDLVERKREACCVRRAVGRRRSSGPRCRSCVSCRALEAKQLRCGELSRRARPGR